MTHPFLKSCIAALLCLFSYHVVYANDRSYASDNWLKWKEDEITSFPQFSPQKSITIELDRRSPIQWRVDPATISLGEDRISRYVVLAVSKSGVVNAMYEGIFCKEGTYKVYARAIGKEDQSDFQWRTVENPQWQSISTLPPSAHERALARLVMCENHASATSVDAIIQRLKKPYSAPASPGGRWE